MAAYAYQEEVNLPVLDELRRLPRGARVLDVGCGRAALGEAAGALGLEVTGVEQHPDAAAVARGRVYRLVEDDLVDVDAVARALGDQRFDAIVFSDVLEHVAWPAAVLDAYRRFLADDGVVVVSLPNVVAWDNRARILAGRFDYVDSGVMDRTHLRFFTVKTARALVEAAGLRVRRVSGDPMLARALLPLVRGRVGAGSPRGLLESPVYRRYVRWVLPIERRVAGLWPSGLWFRIVVVGAPGAG